MSKLTREHIIEEARRIAKKLGVQKLARRDFSRETKISTYQIYSLFPDDGWRGVQKAAGLEITLQNLPLSEEQMMEEFHKVVKDLGRIPTLAQFNARAKISGDVLQKRLGGTKGIVQHYRQWLEQSHPNAPELLMIPVKSMDKVLPKSNPQMQGKNASSHNYQWSKGEGTIFGAPISFRGLSHAPINELGVVYLFGMVSAELGFRVEAVQSAFPDCEAKRCIDRKSDRWQRVRIEFEYYSSNFKDHGHDPKGCDLIVCWDHDWHDCPLEVIELCTVIDKLENKHL